MVVIAILSGCAGQAADAASAYTQVKMEDALTLLKIPVRMSRYLDTSTEAQMAQIMHGPAWKIQSFLLETDRTIMGKAI